MLSTLRIAKGQSVVDHYWKVMRLCKDLDPNMLDYGKRCWLANSLPQEFQDVTFFMGDISMSNLEERLRLHEEF